MPVLQLVIVRPFYAIVAFFRYWINFELAVLQNDLVVKDFLSLEYILSVLSSPLAWSIAACLLLWHRTVRLYDSEGQLLCMSKSTIVGRQEFYRIWTARISHVHDLHLLLNALVLFIVLESVGKHLESSFIQPLSLIVCIWIVSTPIYLAIASYKSAWSVQYVMGCSDIIFGLFAFDGITMYLLDNEWNSLLGPFWKLIIIYIKAPHETSFMAHLSGLLAGLVCYFWGRGIFESFPIVFAIITSWIFAGAYFWIKRLNQSALSANNNIPLPFSCSDS